MKINPGIFKAYDIRGVYGEDFDDKAAYALGLAYIKLRKQKEDKEKFKIVVAEDMRLSSPALKKELINGLLDAGADVVDIGLASTPTFYFAVANFGYDGGIIVSASHNPAKYNGFKLVKEKAIPISGDTGMYDLRDLVISGDIEKSEIKGKLEVRSDVLEKQLEYDLKLSDISSIKPLKVAVDAANSMGAQYLEKLFEKLPCELIKMNFELDGTFPSHEADPLKPENLIDLEEKVKASGADLGIATDGDGDRIFFVDDQGRSIEPGIIRAILSKIFLEERPGSKTAYDIRPGKITEDTILKHGGIPVVTRVGHSLIKEQAIKEGAYFAGESSGHFFLNMDIGCFEIPMIVTLKLLEEFSKSGKSVSEYIADYQIYFHSGEINTKVNDPDAVIQRIKEKYSDGKLFELDIISIEYPDYWFNVRKSNTEPLLRLNLEARTKEVMEQKRDEILAIIREDEIRK